MNKKIINIKTTSQSALINSLIIILIGFVVFYIDDNDFFDYRLTLGLALIICVFKCGYFTMVSYHKILEASLKNTAYYKFILFMSINIFVIIISFAIDYFCLIQIDPSCLKGINLHTSLPEKFFDCFYFSLLNFSFFGYGDIMPATIPAKTVLMIETLISYLSIIIVLSDFVSLKDSLAEAQKNKNQSND